jgi:metal-dependent amidase/aminoacylase/carboxypeptidase family protein
MDSLLSQLKRGSGMAQTDHYDMVVFSATTLHLLAKPNKSMAHPELAFNLEENIQKGVATIRRQGSLPVVMSVHNVCDEKFTGNWNVSAHSSHLQADIRNRCQQEYPTNVKHQERCRVMVMTGKGAESAANLERAAVNAIVPPVDFIDAFNLTKGKCWATPLYDGRHYLTLLPLEVQLISHVVSKNLSSFSSQ